MRNVVPRSTSLASLGPANNFGEIGVDGGTLTAGIRDGAERAKVKLTAG